MRNGKIGVTTENIFPVIKKFLYSDHEIFLRELVSNAVDATQKLKTLSSKGEFKGELGDLTIHISADTDKKTLTINSCKAFVPVRSVKSVSFIHGITAIKPTAAALERMVVILMTDVAFSNHSSQ